jgi:shikimate kinase
MSDTNGNIFLIGFMGTGKTSVSKCLAKKSGMDVIEMDDVISEREGMSVSEIFRIYGEERFRDDETILIKEMAERKNMIISCGGGAPLREENVSSMKKSGLVVLLTASPETVLKRVAKSHERPILEGHKNVEFIRSLMEKRKEKYLLAADLIIDTNGKTIDLVASEIAKKL